MQAARLNILLVVIASLIGLLAYQQSEVISNQKAQMRQQFQADGLVLWGILGDDGLNKIRDGGEFTAKESMAAGSLLHRMILIQKDISVAYTSEERTGAYAECRALLISPLMQKKWKDIKPWWSKDSQGVIDGCLPKP